MCITEAHTVWHSPGSPESNMNNDIDRDAGIVIVHRCHPMCFSNTQEVITSDAASLTTEE